MKIVVRKSLFLIATFIVLSLSLYSVRNIQAQEYEVEAAVESYFSYLKNGDTDGILSLLTDPVLSERRKLLEENTTYPEFLRENYRGSDMEIKRVREIKGERKSVAVEIYFEQPGPPLKTKFILERVDNSWKISEEISS